MAGASSALDTSLWNLSFGASYMGVCCKEFKNVLESENVLENKLPFDLMKSVMVDVVVLFSCIT